MTHQCSPDSAERDFCLDNQVLTLMLSSSCFGRDVCQFPPCACAQSLADLISRRQPGSESLQEIVAAALFSKWCAEAETDGCGEIFWNDWINDNVFNVVGLSKSHFLEEAKALLSSIPDGAVSLPVRAAAQSAWQPIETAPKDGTSILLYGPQVGGSKSDMIGWSGNIVASGYYDGIDSSWCVTGSTWRGPFIGATHWMPLPAGPALSSTKCDDDQQPGYTQYTGFRP